MVRMCILQVLIFCLLFCRGAEMIHAKNQRETKIDFSNIFRCSIMPTPSVALVWIPWLAEAVT